MKILKKCKCPACLGTATQYIEGDYIIVKCRSKKNCEYINKRKVDLKHDNIYKGNSL